MPSCRKAAIFPYQTFSPGPLWHPQVCNSLPHSSQNWCIEGHAPLNPKISIKQFFQGTFQASFSWKGQWVGCEMHFWAIPCKASGSKTVVSTEVQCPCQTGSLRHGSKYFASATQLSQPDIQPGSMPSAWLSGLFFHSVHPVAVGSQDLKAVALKEPVNLLASLNNGHLRGKWTNSRKFPPVHRR